MQCNNYRVRQEGHVYSRTSSLTTSTHRLQYRTRHVATSTTRNRSTHVRQQGLCRLTVNHSHPVRFCNFSPFLSYSVPFSTLSNYHFALSCHTCDAVCKISCEVWYLCCKVWQGGEIRVTWSEVWQNVMQGASGGRGVAERNEERDTSTHGENFVPCGKINTLIYRSLPLTNY